MLDTTTAFGRTLQEIAESRGIPGADELVRRANRDGRPEGEFPWCGFGDDLDAAVGTSEEERARLVETFAQTYSGKPAKASSGSAAGRRMGAQA